jgi:cyclic pyranopterin phosphate synthase
MIDISNKEPVLREASAQAKVRMNKKTLEMIIQKELPKGEVLHIAEISGVQAGKQTWQLIPFCHPLNITHFKVKAEVCKDDSCLILTSKVRAIERTGVEMEALVSVSIAALTVYDMCKSIDPQIKIEEIFVLEKKKGVI